MSHRIHSQARTTPKTRAEIRASDLSQSELMARYSVSKATIHKWQNRDDVEDRSHRPHTLKTTLSPAEELVVVELRRLLLLPLDDLVAVTQAFINPAATRSGINRCLVRHDVGSLRELQPASDDEAKPVKTFKDYEPGFVHIDIKYLPQMPDETQRRYLFVAIDRATRWVYLHIYADQTEQRSVDFLHRVQRAAPMTIQKVLTDNGSQFTDRFTSRNKQPSGGHAFDQACAPQGIEHRLTPPRHPQTNGMVERFNGRIAEVVKQTRFASAAELQATLERYLTAYNHHIPQRALKHQTPIQALKTWQQKRPELFTKRVYNHAELDNYAHK
jgi:hypothetical protein